MAMVDVTPEQAASLLAAAKQCDGKPYLTGGGAKSNPTDGFDRSGLVWYAIIRRASPTPTPTRQTSRMTQPSAS
jgi:cell wall-associated NlpC family hydrolase